MRNSSHRPGCMRALPASQSCHVRSVEEMSTAAAVWESPASSRACRISAGVGLCTCGSDVANIGGDACEHFARAEDAVAALIELDCAIYSHRGGSFWAVTRAVSDALIHADFCRLLPPT